MEVILHVIHMNTAGRSSVGAGGLKPPYPTSWNEGCRKEMGDEP